VNKELEEAKKIYKSAHPMASGIVPEEPENLDDFTADDWREYLETQKLVGAKALVSAMKDGKVKASEVFWKLLGEYIEKSEHRVEFEISAAEHIRIDREADRRIQEVVGRTDRSEGLSEEPPLLSG